MSRYHVDTPARLELVRLALDQAAGYRNASGQPVVVMHKIVDRGVVVGEIRSDVFCATRGVEPTRCCDPVIVGADGTAALEIPETPDASLGLGRTVHGTAVPTAASLVQVTRPRDASRLPAGVRDRLDDRYVDEVFANPVLSTTAKEAAVTLELQTTRAAAALARRPARDAQRVIDAALGGGR